MNSYTQNTYTHVFRFAPSPNGYLHLGHAYSALLNYDMARETGGRLLLRIEDIDTPRSRPEYEAAIYEDLEWLGISWQQPVRRQSEHFADYEAALLKLNAQGLLYPSFESRSEIAALVAERDRYGRWPRDPDGVPLYPGRARKLPAADRKRRVDAGEPYALRLAIDAAVAQAGVLTWTEAGSGPHGQTGTVTAAPMMWGDVVVARKEIPTSYHLAVTLDDALQGVSDVVRGQDLFWSTSIHRLLQALLGLPEPVYHHHRLILDAEGRKLSKSTQAKSLARIARRRRHRAGYPAHGRARPLAHDLGKAGPSLFCLVRGRGIVSAAPGGLPWCDQNRRERDLRKSPLQSARDGVRRAGPPRRRWPRSRTTSAPRSPASWRSANCWRAPISASASGAGPRASRPAPNISPR